MRRRAKVKTLNFKVLQEKLDSLRSPSSIEWCTLNSRKAFKLLKPNSWISSTFLQLFYRFYFACSPPNCRSSSLIELNWIPRWCLRVHTVTLPIWVRLERHERPRVSSISYPFVSSRFHSFPFRIRQSETSRLKSDEKRTQKGNQIDELHSMMLSRRTIAPITHVFQALKTQKYQKTLEDTDE